MGAGFQKPVEITTHYSLTTSRQLKLYLRPSGDVGKASKRPIRAFPKLSGALLWPALSYQDIEQLKLVRSFPSSLPQTRPSEGVLVKTPSTHVQTRFFRLLDQTALKLEQEAYICQINSIPGHLLLLSAISPWMVGKPSWMGGIGQGCSFGLGSLAQADMQALSGSQASTSDTFSSPSLTFQWLLWVSGLLAYTGADRSLESLLSSLSYL